LLERTRFDTSCGPRHSGLRFRSVTSVTSPYSRWCYGLLSIIGLNRMRGGS